MVTDARTARTDEDETVFAGAFRALSVGLLILVTMIAFEEMAVGPALPTAARELHGLAAFGWAFTGFLLANVVGMVASGQLSDAKGPRLPMATGIVLFIAGLAIAGTSTTMAQLIVSRIVQGFGSGLLITAMYVLIGQTYPERLQPKVFTVISAAWMLPALLGPVVSGSLTQHLSWRWVFLGLLPFTVIGACLMVPILRRLARPAPTGAPAGDPRRIVRAIMVAAGVAAFAEAGQHLSPLSVVVAVIGLALLGYGLRGLLPKGTFTARPGVSSAVALRGLLAGAMFGAETVVPLMLMVQHGVGATAAGLPLTFSGLVWAFGSWWQAREVPGDDGARRTRLMRAGFVSLTIGLALVVVTTFPASPWWLAYAAWAFAGLGAGLSITTAGVLLLKWTNDDDRGRDSAALQLSDTTSASLTSSIAGMLVAAAAAGSIGYTGAFIVVDAVMLGIAVLGVLAAGRARSAPVSEAARSVAA